MYKARNVQKRFDANPRRRKGAKKKEKIGGSVLFRTFMVEAKENRF